MRVPRGIVVLIVGVAAYANAQARPPVSQRSTQGSASCDSSIRSARAIRQQAVLALDSAASALQALSTSSDAGGIVATARLFGRAQAYLDLDTTSTDSLLTRVNALLPAMLSQGLPRVVGTIIERGSLGDDARNVGTFVASFAVMIRPLVERYGGRQ